MDLPKKQNRQKNSIRFQMPDLPPEMWCDFRVDLAEKHMTLTELAAKYSCDPRTVRACIQCNKSSSELGKQSVPTKIQIYEPHIRNLLLNMKTVPDDICTIYSLSRYLYPLLQQQGYTGSERTLRNHLSEEIAAKFKSNVRETWRVILVSKADIFHTESLRILAERFSQSET